MTIKKFDNVGRDFETFFFVSVGIHNVRGAAVWSKRCLSAARLKLVIMGLFSSLLAKVFAVIA